MARMGSVRAILSPTIANFMSEFVFTEFSREEEELLAGAPDEFLCPIMSILMTDPVSFIFTRGPRV